MIGNDVVDLKLANKQNNWQRNRFMDKIFTKNEQILIHKSENQEITVWNLWTRKEAVYKIWNRETGIRKYNPIQFECSGLDLEIGKVVIKNKVHFTKTKITSEYVYTIAVSKISDFEKIKTLQKPIEIEKKNGIPFYSNENQIIMPISKTNHGRFEKIISF